MEYYDLRFHRGRRPAFGKVPAAARRRIFGVDYVLVQGLQGGDLYFTRAGWAVADSLLPMHWYDNERFCRVGRALTAGTGSVYRVPVPHRARGSLAVVVKFCRFGQDVGVLDGGGGDVFPWSEAVQADAEFLGPFAEFGRVEELRRSLGPGRWFGLKRPLAIYCPSVRFLRWQLGRNPSRDWCHDRPLAADQAAEGAKAVRHDWERLYILLYQWIDGVDAQEAFEDGLIDAATLTGLARRSARDLAAAGFAVLDHKPRHVIVRPTADGLVSRRGVPVYAIIDYELLVPYRPAAGGAGVQG